ncbi:MAG: hypothetical protein NC452_01935 [Eubacterium sp.]|nr:hypothetical protein [Eubacterium sp.]
MKKCKTVSAILALAMTAALLSGCKDSQEQESGQPETSAASAQVTEASEAADGASEAEDVPDDGGSGGADSADSAETAGGAEEKAPEPTGFKAYSAEQNGELAEKLSELKDGDGNYIFDKSVSVKLRRTVSEDEISVSDFYAADVYRESANMLCADLEDEAAAESFRAALNASPKSRWAKDLSDINISENDVVLKLKVNGTLPPEIVSVTQSYTLTDLTVTGFVCRNKDNTFDVIVDPAYMYNIPVPVWCDAKYSLGSTEVLADSISFTAQKGVHAETVKDISGDYVYARMKVNRLTVSYDSLGNNYSLADTIGDIDIIYDNISDALENSVSAAKFADKDNSAAASVYGTLLDHIDMFMDRDVVGVNLIDLDFDDFPELLVSKQLLAGDPGFPDRRTEQCNVEVYSLKNGDVSYIDTLYNSKANVYYNGNVIGLKTTEKLEKKWFCMSRKDLNGGDFYTESNYNYLFTLENGRLNYTEVFSERPTVTDPETGATDYDYYFYGEKIVPTVTRGEGPYEGEEDWEYHSWNGITATFGMWELFGFIRAEYCSDIEQVYDLYSDWLYSVNGDDPDRRSEYQATGKKLFVGERTMKYKLAYLTDAFWYGEYDPEENGFKYWFLGDYAKPVIYLYPEEKTDVSVKLSLNGEITCSYPDYRDGWEVTAYPDGTITDKYDGEEYYCLYWEGKGALDWDMSKGFAVKREDTADFLRSKLKEIGFTPHESNEFIIYWLPELQKNECNFITFQTGTYEKNAKLEIDPVPDSMLRVFMVYEPCDKDFAPEPQEFETFERNGFTVVDWGGQKK